ncbi:MAG: hypothetical protein KC543_07515 [Myxococcales bacterium]|nr:hypothetical protein [Myxococcales bacterium]
MTRTRCLSAGSVALAILAACALMAPSRGAAAQAVVTVKVRTPDGAPADGRVVLEPKAGGEAHGCTTQAGECRMEGVPGGRYVARFVPRQGAPPAPREVMIPPSGEVTLYVATR